MDVPLELVHTEELPELSAFEFQQKAIEFEAEVAQELPASDNKPVDAFDGEPALLE